MTATSSWSTCRAPACAQMLEQRRADERRRRPTRCRSTQRDRLHARDPARVRLPARPRPAVLRLQARQRDPAPVDAVKLIDLGGVYRMADDVERDLRHAGLPGARDRADAGRRIATRRVHRRADTGRACAPTRVASRARYEYDAARRPTTCRCSAGTTRCTACSHARPRPTPTTASSRPTRWAMQLLGVLREVVARESGTDPSAPATLFAPELRSALDAPRLARAPGAPRRAPTIPLPASCASLRDRRRERDDIHRAARRRARTRRSRCSCGTRGARSTLGRHDEAADNVLDDDRRRRPVGVAGCLVPRAAPRSSATSRATARSVSSTACTARCPASSRRSSRWRSPREQSRRRWTGPSAGTTPSPDRSRRTRRAVVRAGALLSQARRSPRHARGVRPGARERERLPRRRSWPRPTPCSVTTRRGTPARRRRRRGTWSRRLAPGVERARLEAALFELALGVVRETGDDPSAASRPRPPVHRRRPAVSGWRPPTAPSPGSRRRPASGSSSSTGRTAATADADVKVEAVVHCPQCGGATRRRRTGSARRAVPCSSTRDPARRWARTGSSRISADWPR